MAFEGDLSDLALGDIFQTLAMTRQSGTLCVRGTEERRIAFSAKGIAVLSRRDSLGRWLGEYLVGVGALSPEDFEKAQTLLRRRREGFLGDVIQELDVVPEKPFFDAMRYLAQEELFDLFLWKTGKFEFEPGEPDTSAPFASMWFDVGGIAMEAARRMDETERIGDRVHPSHVFVRLEGVDPDGGGAELSENERRVLAVLDGTKTTGNLLSDFFLGDFDIKRSLGTLLDLGLIRAASVEEILDGAATSMQRRAYDRAAVLYDLACMLDPERGELRAQAGEALIKSGEKRGASHQFAEYGRWLLRSGDNSAAAEAFKKAVRLDNANSAAHEGTMHALFERGEIDEGVDAARSAVKAWLAVEDPRSALRVCTVGLNHAPGDVALRMLTANAHLAAGERARALEGLDDLASILETTGENDKRLLDVYRQILHLDDKRKDCQKRIEEIQAFAQAQRRRTVQRLAVGIGLVLASLMAIPFIAGPGIDGRLDALDAMIADGDIAGANEALAGFDPTPLDEAQRIRLGSLRSKLTPKTDDKTSGTRVLTELTAAVEARYETSSQLLQESRPTAALVELLSAFDAIDNGATANSDAAARDECAQLKREASREVHLLFAEMASKTAAIGTKFAARRSLFTPEALRKGDFKTMQELVAEASQAAAVLAGDDWKSLERTVGLLVARSGAPADNAHLRVVENSIRILEDGRFIAEQGEKALVQVRTHDLQEQFRQTRNQTTTLEAQGKLPEALECYRRYLDLCREFEHYEPAALYAEARQTFLENVDVDGRVLEKLHEIEDVLAQEKLAAEALSRADYETAWKVRAELVDRHPEINFEKRFWLPVRITTYPAGAAVLVVTAGAEPRKLGVTPMIVNCTLAGTSSFAVRLDGFFEYVVERRGAKDPRGGLESVDLVKVPLLVNEPESSHTTEAPAAASPTHVYLLGRDGTVRSVSRSAPFKSVTVGTDLLDGMAGGAAVTDSAVFVASLDGSGFVFDPETLERRATFKLGAGARSTGIVAGEDAVFADESGHVARIAPDGSKIWDRDVGKIVTDGDSDGRTLYYSTVEGELVGLDAADGSDRLRVRLSKHPRWRSPNLAGTRVYVGCDDGRVACVDLTEGRIIWQQELKVPVFGRVAVVGERVIAATGSGLHVLSAKNGEPERRILLGALPRVGVLALPDGFAAVTETGVISRFDATGELSWRYDLQETILAPMALLGGEIVITTRRGKVVALSR